MQLPKTGLIPEGSSICLSVVCDEGGRQDR